MGCATFSPAPSAECRGGRGERWQEGGTRTRGAGHGSCCLLWARCLRNMHSSLQEAAQPTQEGGPPCRCEWHRCQNPPDLPTARPWPWTQPTASPRGPGSSGASAITTTSTAMGHKGVGYTAWGSRRSVPDTLSLCPPHPSLPEWPALCPVAALGTQQPGH